MKKILVLTDSLGLARDFPEVTYYEQTWPVLLRNENYNVHQVSLGGATSNEIVSQMEYHKQFRPDFTVVQVGIVDCAPRFLTRKEQAFVRMFPFYKMIFKILNTPNVKARRKITYTSVEKFEKNIDFINKYFDGKVLFVGILSPTINYEKQLPGVTKNTTNFNLILSKYNYIDVSSMPSEGIMTDNHHLNELGHMFIYEKIYEYIKKK